jgi:hypothetical protein
MKRLKKSRGKGRSSRPIQYGALPYREIKSGVQILLVTVARHATMDNSKRLAAERNAAAPCRCAGSL